MSLTVAPSYTLYTLQLSYLPVGIILQQMWLSTSPTLQRSFLGLLCSFLCLLYWFIPTLRQKILLMHTPAWLTQLCILLGVLVGKILEPFLLESTLVLSFSIFGRLMLVLKLIIITFGLLNGVLQCLGFVKIDLILVGLW
jgi:hypothetical protein